MKRIFINVNNDERELERRKNYSVFSGQCRQGLPFTLIFPPTKCTRGRLAFLLNAQQYMYIRSRGLTRNHVTARVTATHL